MDMATTAALPHRQQEYEYRQEFDAEAFDDEDTFSCRTDLTTVKISNVSRRVSLSPIAATMSGSGKDQGEDSLNKRQIDKMLLELVENNAAGADDCLRKLLEALDARSPSWRATAQGQIRELFEHDSDIIEKKLPRLFSPTNRHLAAARVKQMLRNIKSPPPAADNAHSGNHDPSVLLPPTDDASFLSTQSSLTAASVPLNEAEIDAALLQLQNKAAAGAGDMLRKLLEALDSRVHVCRAAATTEVYELFEHDADIIKNVLPSLFSSTNRDLAAERVTQLLNLKLPPPSADNAHSGNHDPSVLLPPDDDSFSLTARLFVTPTADDDDDTGYGVSPANVPSQDGSFPSTLSTLTPNSAPIGTNADEKGDDTDRMSMALKNRNQRSLGGGTAAHLPLSSPPPYFGDHSAIETTSSGDSSDVDEETRNKKKSAKKDNTTSRGESGLLRDVASTSSNSMSDGPTADVSDKQDEDKDSIGQDRISSARKTKSPGGSPANEASPPADFGASMTEPHWSGDSDTFDELYDVASDTSSQDKKVRAKPVLQTSTSTEVRNLGAPARLSSHSSDASPRSTRSSPEPFHQLETIPEVIDHVAPHVVATPDTVQTTTSTGSNSMSGGPTADISDNQDEDKDSIAHDRILSARKTKSPGDSPANEASFPFAFGAPMTEQHSSGDSDLVDEVVQSRVLYKVASDSSSQEDDLDNKVRAKPVLQASTSTEVGSLGAPARLSSHSSDASPPSTRSEPFQLENIPEVIDHVAPLVATPGTVQPTTNEVTGGSSQSAGCCHENCCAKFCALAFK